MYDFPWMTKQKYCKDTFERVIKECNTLLNPSKVEFELPEYLLEQMVDLVAGTLEFLNGRKWGFHIVTALHLGGKLGFGDLSRLIKGISNRALSTRLKEMAETGLLVRHTIPGPPLGTRYELTEHGGMVALLMTPIVYYMKLVNGELDEPPAELIQAMIRAKTEES